MLIKHSMNKLITVDVVKVCRLSNWIKEGMEAHLTKGQSASGFCLGRLLIVEPIGLKMAV